VSPDLDASFEESGFPDYEYYWQDYAEEADYQTYDPV